MRLLAVLFIALLGLIGGAVAGFIAAVIIRPDASPEYMFRGSFVGMFALLWMTGSFGRLVLGAVCGLLGAGVGWIVGWILDRMVFHTGGAVAKWGMILGAILFSLRPPFSGRRSNAKLDVRGRNPGRQSARDSGGFQMPVSTGTGTPTIPGYRSDGRQLGIQELQSELRTLAPGVGFGEARSGDNSVVASDLHFYAADREWVETEFYRYLAQRMDVDGIREWTEEKFDCDDFAQHLNTCATLAMQRSPLRGGTHAFFTAIVNIAEGSSVLGVGGGTDAYHANNLVRCTDGRWYFVEPQMALGKYSKPAGVLQAAAARIPAAAAVLRQVQSPSGAPENWMCPLDSAVRRGNQGEVRLLQARF